MTFAFVLFNMIYNRQKLLLQVVNVLSKKGISSKTYIVKALFLLRQKLGFDMVGYDFFPYKYGPFSNEIYNDFNYLEKEGLFNESKLRLTDEGKRYVNSLKKNEKTFSELNEIISSFASSSKIKDFVYENFPAFTVRSTAVMQELPKEKGVCSIGYEGRTIDAFLNELIRYNVSLLVDVRKNAFSMKKGFSKNQLKHFLEKAGIKYLHLPELGIESEKRKELNSREDYLELFKEYKKSLFAKKEKIEELKKLAENERIALMCFEADKSFCHRGVLSDFLNKEVVHI
jgi:uncharacterized protein (DUF488 family)